MFRLRLTIPVTVTVRCLMFLSSITIDQAIIFVTPVTDKGANLNPHPIGVYYVGNKWNIFNLDQTTIPDRSQIQCGILYRG